MLNIQGSLGRPKKCRMVESLPQVTYFKPAGIPVRFLNEVQLKFEEAEALRLKELEGLEQEEGAARMFVSRATFQRILTSARKKTADAVLNGKAIRIEGGSYRLNQSKIQDVSSNEIKTGVKPMRYAIPVYGGQLSA